MVWSALIENLQLHSLDWLEMHLTDEHFADYYYALQNSIAPTVTLQLPGTFPFADRCYDFTNDLNIGGGTPCTFFWLRSCQSMHILPYS